MVQAYLELLKSWKDVRGRMRRDKFWEAFTCNVIIVVLLVMFTMRLGGVFEYIQMIYQKRFIFKFFKFVYHILPSKNCTP